MSKVIVLLAAMLYVAASLPYSPTVTNPTTRESEGKVTLVLPKHSCLGLIIFREHMNCII